MQTFTTEEFSPSDFRNGNYNIPKAEEQAKLSEQTAPGEFSPSTYTPYTGKETPQDIMEFHNVPTDRTYNSQRPQDFTGNTLVEKAAKTAYDIAPAVAKKQYDRVANEYDSINNALNGNYREEIFFGENPKDIFAAWDINRTESLADKQKKFKEYYPNGYLRVLPHDGKSVLVAKTDSTQPWTKLGTNVVDKAISSTFSLSTAGAIAGEALGAKTVPIVGGPLGAGAGSFFGDVADRMIEKERGNLQEESVFTRNQIPMAVANTLISWYGKGGSLSAGAKLFENPPTQRAAEAGAFAASEGLPPITFGQAASNPIIAAWQRQATSLDAATRRKAIDSNLAAVRKFLTFINDATPGAPNLDQNVLQQVLGMARYNLEAIIGGMRNKEIPTSEGMKRLKAAFDNWDEIVGGNNGAIDQAFSKVLKLSDDISFDVSAARRRVKELIDGVQGEGTPTPVGKLSEKTPPSADNPRGGLGIATKDNPVQLSEDPKGELLSAMKAIQDLKSDIITPYTNPSSGNTFGSYEQLKTLITRFGRLTESPDASISGIAKQVYGPLKEALDTATIHTEGLSPEKATAFTEAWKSARQLYKDYLTLKDDKVISTITDMNATNYQSLGDRLVAPGNAEFIRTVSAVVPEGKGILKGILYNKLFAGERNQFGWEKSVRDVITGFTNAGDKESLELLLGPGERENLIKYAKMREELESGILPKLANRDVEASRQAFDAITKGDGEAVNTILQVAGGPNSSAGQALIRGVLQRMYQNSIVNMQQHGDVFVYSKFKDEIDLLKTNKVIEKLFTHKQIEFLENLDKYVDVVHINLDSGTNLQTAAVAAGIVRNAAKGSKDVAEGKVEQGVGRVVSSFVLPISYKLGGSFLLNGAKDFAAASGNGNVYRRTANQIAMKAMINTLRMPELKDDTGYSQPVRAMKLKYKEPQIGNP